MQLPIDISTLIITYATGPVYSFPCWVDKSQYLRLLRYMEWNPRASRLIKKLGMVRFGEKEMSKFYRFDLNTVDTNTINAYKNRLDSISEYDWDSYYSVIDDPRIIDLINKMAKSRVLINYDYEVLVMVCVQMSKNSNSEIPNTIYIKILAIHNTYLLIDKYEHSRTRFIKKVVKILDKDYVSKSARSKTCLLL